MSSLFNKTLSTIVAVLTSPIWLASILVFTLVFIWSPSGVEEDE